MRSLSRGRTLHETMEQGIGMTMPYYDVTTLYHVEEFGGAGLSRDREMPAWTKAQPRFLVAG